MPLKLLALETAGLAGSVALAEGGRPIIARTLAEGQRSAQSLAPGIRQVLAEAGWQPADLALVAVVVGPGSFTGLRVGVTTAKTLAYALGIEVLGLNCLEVIAHQAHDNPTRERHELLDSLSPAGEAPETTSPLPEADPANGASADTLEVVLDAQRRELFWARFELVPGAPQTAPRWLSPAPGQILAIDDWLGGLLPGTRVSGPALDKLLPRLPDQNAPQPRAHWFPQAATVARLAWIHWQAGRRDDLWRLAPAYLRSSAAEERRNGPHDQPAR